LKKGKEMFVLNLLEELLGTHRYFLGTEKLFKMQAFLLYFYKKNIEDFIEGRKRLIAEEKEKTGMETHSPLLEEAEEFLRKIEQVLKENPEINEIVGKLEKRNLIIQITESIESEKRRP